MLGALFAIQVWLPISRGSSKLSIVGWRDPAAYVLAFFFGASVGLAELVARYRDRPAAAISSGPAAIYMGINGLASLVAFWLLHTGRLVIPVTVFGPAHSALNALVLGGFGAMALFCTSIFNVRVGDTSVAIGPAAMLQVVLRATDRETDRLRAGPRAARVGKIMLNVVYERARDALPLHCFALMQNLTLEEQVGLEQALAVLDKKAAMGDQAKAYSLGLLLLNLVGEDVLERAVSGLGDRIKGPVPDQPPVLARAADLQAGDLASILEGCRALSTTSAETDADLIAPPVDVTLDSDRVVIALMRLRKKFGPETVAETIDKILRARTGVSIEQVDQSDLDGDADGQDVSPIDPAAPPAGEDRRAEAVTANEQRDRQ